MQDRPVALVTGANKGIGLQIAKHLVVRGFTVLVGSRTLEHGETAAKSAGAEALALQLDVTNQASIAAAAERIRNDLGRLDVLVNNAGILHAGEPGRPLEEMVESTRLSVASLDEVRAVFETNVFGVIAVTQAMLPLLREAPAGTHRQRFERRRLADDTCEPTEQGKATSCGGRGGKGAAGGEHRSIAHAPDSEQDCMFLPDPSIPKSSQKCRDRRSEPVSEIKTCDLRSS
jgi:NAD(P)-dependent dehydrogenase (short-subunit alcohol dehydrogenase family)